MNKIPYIVIVALVIVILLMRGCGSDVSDSSQTTYVRTDTVYKHTHDTINKKVNVVSVRYVKTEAPFFISLDTCNKEYNMKTVYSDIIKIDSIGKITIIDTVFQNKLLERTIFKDYKIPTVTKTVTITNADQKVRQLYIGGNLFGDKGSLQIASPGVLYKDKKDRVYQLNVGINFDGTIVYGVGAYWKVKLKK